MRGCSSPPRANHVSKMLATSGFRHSDGARDELISLDFTLISAIWAEWESNPHGFPRRILSPLRLPFRHPPPSRNGLIKQLLPAIWQTGAGLTPPAPAVRIRLARQSGAKHQDEETGYWLITMECEEPHSELTLFDTDYATTKAKFEAFKALSY